jgi:hypothetical protein
MLIDCCELNVLYSTVDEAITNSEQVVYIYQGVETILNKSFLPIIFQINLGLVKNILSIWWLRIVL